MSLTAEAERGGEPFADEGEHALPALVRETRRVKMFSLFNPKIQLTTSESPPGHETSTATIHAVRTAKHLSTESEWPGEAV